MLKVDSPKLKRVSTRLTLDSDDKKSSLINLLKRPRRKELRRIKRQLHEILEDDSDIESVQSTMQVHVSDSTACADKAVQTYENHEVSLVPNLTYAQQYLRSLITQTVTKDTKFTILKEFPDSFTNSYLTGLATAFKYRVLESRESIDSNAFCEQICSFLK